jgi:peptidoglycan/xylan/chitin deacetylase (PgdA/CDA1 family)
MLRHFLPLTYPAYLTSRTLLRAMGVQGPKLRVLLYHDVAPGELETFSATLRWLQKSWDFLAPLEFEEVMQGRRTLARDSLLLTFDDGFASNRIVAEQVLQPLGIHAIFFVVADFIEQSDSAGARNFIYKRLKVSVSPALVPAHLENMGWKDLYRLLELGHSIGAHTTSHERLTDNIDPGLMHREIIGAADWLESELSTRVRHFAFPFGDFDSFSMPAMRLAMTRFDFIHSGLRGDNHPGSMPCTIRRDSLKPDDSKSLVGAFLLGASDFRYRRLNGILDSWVLSPP